MLLISKAFTPDSIFDRDSLVRRLVETVETESGTRRIQRNVPLGMHGNSRNRLPSEHYATMWIGRITTSRKP